jgi:hypothetical protein
MNKNSIPDDISGLFLVVLASHLQGLAICFNRYVSRYWRFHLLPALHAFIAFTVNFFLTGAATF